MKKIISFLLVLAMVMAIPFSAFSVSAERISFETSYDFPDHPNVAIGKTYTTSRTNKGVSSAYHPLNCNADLTDGVTKWDDSPEALYDNTWFAFQTYANTVVEHGTYGTVGEIYLDLGAVYDVTGIGMYTVEGSFMELLDGTKFESHFDDINVYGKKNLNDDYIYLNSLYGNTYNNPGWKECHVSCEEVRYIKFEVTVDTGWLWYDDIVDPVAYALISEIAVYGVPASDNYYENLALNATYKVYDDSGKAVKTTRGYTGKLNDGIMDVPLVSHKYNSKTGKYNANDGKWFGLFCNSGASDQNLPSGEAYIIFDLGKVSQVEMLNVFIPKDYSIAPTNIGYSFSMDGVNYNLLSSYVSGFYGSEYKYGVKESLKLAVECRYIKITMNTAMFWGIFNEIQIMGRYDNHNIAYGKSSETRDATGLIVSPTRGYYGDLTDGVADVPVVSYLKNPNTGAENCNDGKWFGLFNNSATPEENCTVGRAKTVIDLDRTSNVEEVRVFTSDDPILTAHMILVGVYDEDMNLLNDYTEFNVKEGKYGDWKCFKFEDVLQNARYVSVEFVFDGHWCLYNEIQVIGTYK